MVVEFEHTVVETDYSSSSTEEEEEEDYRDRGTDSTRRTNIESCIFDLNILVKKTEKKMYRQLLLGVISKLKRPEELFQPASKVFKSVKSMWFQPFKVNNPKVFMNSTLINVLDVPPDLDDINLLINESVVPVNPFTSCLKDTWNLDVLKLEEQYSNILSKLFIHYMSVTRYTSHFSINDTKLSNFISTVEKSYKPMRYHSSSHAADVLNSTFYLLTELNFINNELYIFASMFAAVVHDVAHPGLTAAYLINTKHPLSILFNDASVLENFHLAKAFQIVSHPECNILENMKSQEYTIFRRAVIESVLATDMKLHFQEMAKIPEKMTLLDISKLVIKVADLGHAGKDGSLHKKWSIRFYEEFKEQTEKEKTLGMKSENISFEESQQGFFSWIVLPMFEIVSKRFSQFSSIHDAAKVNEKMWMT